MEQTSTSERGSTSAQVQNGLEAETCHQLVGLLESMAQLVEHSVASLETVRLETQQAAARCAQAEDQNAVLRRRLDLLRGSLRQKPFVANYISAASIVPAGEAQKSAAKRAAEQQERLHERILLQEQWTPLRCRYSPVQSPSCTPGADHQLERPASFVSRRSAGKLNFSPSALLVPKESPSAPSMEVVSASPSGWRTSEAASGSLRSQGSGQSAARTRPGSGGGQVGVLERREGGQPPTKQQRDGEPPAGTSLHTPQLQQVGMGEASWKTAAVVGREFTRGLEHLIPNMVLPAYMDGTAEAVKTQLSIPAEEAPATVVPSRQAVVVTCNPLYVAPSADTQSVLREPQQTPREHASASSQEEEEEETNSAGAVSVSARSDRQSPIAKQKSAELEALIASRREEAATASTQEVGEASVEEPNARHILREDTLEGQLLPFGVPVSSLAAVTASFSAPSLLDPTAAGAEPSPTTAGIENGCGMEFSPLASAMSGQLGSGLLAMHRTQGHLSQALRDVHDPRLSFLAGLCVDLPTQRTTVTSGLSTGRTGTTELLLTDRTAITVVQRGDPAVVDCQSTERSMTSVDQYPPIVSTDELRAEKLGASLPQHAQASRDSEIRQTVQPHSQSARRTVDGITATKGGIATTMAPQAAVVTEAAERPPSRASSCLSASVQCSPRSDHLWQRESINSHQEPLRSSRAHTGGTATGGPTFLRQTAPGSPILPPEVVLRQGPLGHSARLAEQGSEAAPEKQPAWGASRYVLPGDSNHRHAAGWRFHDKPPSIPNTRPPSVHSSIDAQGNGGFSAPFRNPDASFQHWAATGDPLFKHLDAFGAFAPDDALRKSHGGFGDYGASEAAVPMDAYSPPGIGLQHTTSPEAAHRRPKIGTCGHYLPSPTLPQPMMQPTRDSTGTQQWGEVAGWRQVEDSIHRHLHRPAASHQRSASRIGGTRSYWGEESLPLSAFGQRTSPSSSSGAPWDGSWRSQASPVRASSPPTSPLQAPSPSGRFPRRFGMAPLTAVPGR